MPGLRSHLILIPGGLLVALIAAGGVALTLRPRGNAAPVIPHEAAALYQNAARQRTGTDSTIETYQSYLTKRADDPVLLARLGAAYLQKAREIGDPSWYAKADTVLRRSLDVQPENDD